MIPIALISGQTPWSSAMLVVLLLVFGGILYWTLIGGRHRFDRESRLPLNDERTSGSDPEARRTQP